MLGAATPKATRSSFSSMTKQVSSGLMRGGELPGVLADLIVRQLHGAVQGGIGHVHQLEYLPDQGRVLQTAAHLMDVQALPLQNIGGDLLPALDDPLVRGGRR